MFLEAELAFFVKFAQNFSVFRRLLENYKRYLNYFFSNGLIAQLRIKCINNLFKNGHNTMFFGLKSVVLVKFAQKFQFFYELLKNYKRYLNNSFTDQFVA